MKALVVREENKDNLGKFLAGEIKEIELHAESNPETDIPVKTCVAFIGVSKPDTVLLVSTQLDGQKVVHTRIPSIEDDQVGKSVYFRANSEKTNTGYIKNFIKHNSLKKISKYQYKVKEFIEYIDGQLIRILAVVFNKATYTEAMDKGGLYCELDYTRTEVLSEYDNYMRENGYSDLENKVVAALFNSLVSANLVNKLESEQLTMSV